MKIAIDLDDVLSDTTTSLLKFYNENFRPKIMHGSLDKYSYWEFLGNTREEANKKFFAFTESKHFQEIMPNKEAIPAIEILSKRHELVVITGRPYFLKDETEKWFKRFFSKKFSDIYFTNTRETKHDLSEYWGKPKAKICDEVSAEILIDDLVDYVRASEHLRVYILKKPWKQGVIPKHVKYVKNWEEIVNDINLLSGKD